MINPESHTVYSDVYQKSDNILMFENHHYRTWLTPPKIGDIVNAKGIGKYYEIIIKVVKNYSKKQMRQMKINNLLKE